MNLGAVVFKQSGLVSADPVLRHPKSVTDGPK